MPKPKLLKPHPNSLEATASAEIQTLIMYGRVAADEDLRQKEVWARNGFISGQDLDNPEEYL